MALRTGDYLMNQFKRSPNWKSLSDDELQKLKSVMVSITEDIVDFCQKKNINYILACGTCLGAVRHKGFIPWDDDIDIYMPRKDYCKFLKLAEEYLGEKYYIRSCSKGDKVCIPSIHVRLKESKYINYGDMVLTKDEPQEMRGIYVDIFPVDNVSDNILIRNLQEYLSLFLMFICSCIGIHRSLFCLKKEGVLIDDEAKKIFRFKNTIGVIMGIIPLHFWVRLNDRLISCNHNCNTKYVTCFEDLFGNVNYGEFEGHKWRLPTNTDAFLKKLYGKDYMIPPIQNKQKIHPVFELEFPQS